MSCNHQRNKKRAECDMYGRGEVQAGWWGSLWERDRLEDLGDRKVLNNPLVSMVWNW
jgi:hypothetical protein